MKNLILKYKSLIISIIIVIYILCAKILINSDTLGGFLLVLIFWFATSISGIFIFMDLKVRHSNFEYKLLHHLFLLAFSSIFFIVLWMYLEEEWTEDSIFEMIIAESNFKMKIACLILGSIALLIAIYVIRKDYKKR